MKMRRRSDSVARRADITDRVTGDDGITFLESAPSIEMRVVVNLAPWTEHVDDEAAEPVGAHAHDNSPCSARYRSAAPRKDVDSLMRATSAAGCAPRVRNVPLSNTIHR